MTRALPCSWLTAAALLLVAALAASPARAAEGFDGCTAFITTLPATIGTPGVHCLNADLAYPAANAFAAISITVDNVTIDCNNFKLGGSAAGPATTTSGIRADAVNHVSVRRCLVRGFNTGISLPSASTRGHVIEDNRLDGNTVIGIYASGTELTVRNNVVTDTGGSPVQGTVAGIHLHGVGNVTGNVVNGVSGLNAYGILLAAPAGASVVSANTVRDVLADTGGTQVGIYSDGAGAVIRGNTLMGPGDGTGTAIDCSGGSRTPMLDNVATGINTMSVNCLNAGGNILMP